MEAVSLVCQLSSALVLALNAAPYFRWGVAEQHVDVWSSRWTDASCYETACLIQSCVGELAMRGTGPDRTTILRHGKSKCCRRRPHFVGARTPVRPMQLPQEVFLEESFARASSDSGFGR